MKILNRVEKEKKEQKKTKNNFFDLNNLYIVIINIILIYPFFLSIHNSNNFFLNILKYYNLII